MFRQGSAQAMAVLVLTKDATRCCGCVEKACVTLPAMPTSDTQNHNDSRILRHGVPTFPILLVVLIALFKTV